MSVKRLREEKGKKKKRKRGRREKRRPVTYCKSTKKLPIDFDGVVGRVRSNGSMDFVRRVYDVPTSVELDYD